VKIQLDNDAAKIKKSFFQSNDLLCKMKSIQCIFFDFGNVLIDIDVEQTRNAFKELGADESLEEALPLFHSFDQGFISESEFLSELKCYFPKYINSRQLKEAWNALLISIPETSYPLLRALKENYTLYMLSNTSSTHITEIRRKTGLYHFKKFNSAFEKLYYSFELGMRKPDPDIFKRVVSEAGCAPENCLMVDDLKENLKAAAEIGMKTLHFALDEGGNHKTLYKKIVNI